MSRMKPACLICNQIHASDSARAVGRFTDHATYTASTMPGAPRRETRTEAEADECSWRARNGDPR